MVLSSVSKIKQAPFSLFIACVAFVIFTIISAALPAMDFSLFPAFSCENDKEHEVTDINVAYPVFHYHKNPDETLIQIPIIFSMEKQVESGLFCLDMIWPFISFRRTPRIGPGSFRSQLTVLILFSTSVKEAEDGDYSKTMLFPFWFSGSDKKGHSHYILFPFFWYANDAFVFLPFPRIKPQSYFAIIPFYGIFRGVGGNDVIQTWLWPLFVRVKHEDRRKYHILWPFFGWGRGENYRAWRLWPLFVWARHPDGSVRANYLWPFGYYRRIPDKDGNIISTDILFPFLYRHHSPSQDMESYFIYGWRREKNLRQWGILGPVFKKSYYPETDGHAVSLLGFVFKHKDNGDEKRFQILNLYGRRSREGWVRSFILYPFYQYKYNAFESFTYTRHYVPPFFMKRTTRWHDGRWEKRTVFFPFYASVRKSGGEWETYGGRPFYYDKSRTIERNWGPLLPFYRSTGETDNDYDMRYFWKLYRNAKKDGERIREINALVFQWKRRGGNVKWNLLGGILGREKDALDSKLKILFIPF